jgi:hypothetical protein
MMKKKGVRTQNKGVKRQRKMMKRNGGESQSLKATTRTRARIGMNLIMSKKNEDDSTEELKICCLFITPHEPRGMKEKDNKKKEEDLAFLIGPRLDGIVRAKDG